MQVIEFVCPKASSPVKGPIVGNGTMEKKDWKSKDEMLSGEESKSWKTIIVYCVVCDENHEYALTMNP